MGAGAGWSGRHLQLDSRTLGSRVSIARSVVKATERRVFRPSVGNGAERGAGSQNLGTPQGDTERSEGASEEGGEAQRMEGTVEGRAPPGALRGGGLWAHAQRSSNYLPANASVSDQGR